MQDRFGQALTGADPAARDAYITGLDLLLAARPGVLGHFKTAVAQAPGFALAHAAMGRVLQMQGRMPEAGQAMAKAAELAREPREKSHVDVLSKVLAGDATGALEGLLAHVANWPRDALVLSLTLGVYGLHGFSGMVDHHARQRDLLDQLAPHWGDDWWFCAYRGWAHVEAGNPTYGAPLIARSLEDQRVNGNAAHAYAHAFYEMGAAAPGLDFLQSFLPDYEETGSLYPHLSWHLSLFALRLGKTDLALSMFENRFRPDLGKQAPFFSMVDAGAFNWRCQLRGIGGRDAELREVSAFADAEFATPGLGFANVHAAYAWAAAGAFEALARHVEACRDLAARNVHPSAPVVHAICAGVQAFALGDYAGAAAGLEAMLPKLASIGGSNAQRDAVMETLVVACLRSGQPDKAEKLLQSRLGLRAIFVP